MNDTLLTVEQTFEVLQAHGLTNNIEVVRRWLRQGKLQGIAPGANKKNGWRVEQPILDLFVANRLAASRKESDNTTQIEAVALNEAAIRADEREKMWYEITGKNIWEEPYIITKTQIKDALAHRRYSMQLVDEVWTRLKDNSSAYKQPRVYYLLDAFLFEGKRLLLDDSFSGHERVLFPIIEYVRTNRNK